MLKMNHQWILSLFVGMVLAMTAVSTRAASGPGFLVIAPDRGFLGNEEVRDLFAEFRKTVPKAVIAFATEEKTADNLKQALATLSKERNLSNVVVLPLFLSEHHALYQKARKTLESLNHSALQFARPFGASYLAEEILFDRVETLSSSPDQERLILVAAGAGSDEAESRLREDLKPLLDRAVKKYKLAHKGEIVVIYDWSAPKERWEAAFDTVVARIRDSSGRFPRTLVVPFNFGKRLTMMMSDWHRVHRAIKDYNVTYDGKGILPHTNVLYWLRQASARYLPLKRDDIGVILVPHGSDYNWNETMRQGIRPLRGEYIIEDAFSMVDPVVVRRAGRRLERRGVKAALVVRIFSLEASFQEKAEYILGLRREYRSFPKRIRSGLLFHTLGGLETSPHLARAIIDRIREISRSPEKETVILLAHGTGDEGRNDHWMGNLKTLAEYIRKNGGKRFRAVRYYTWREDWPEKRKEAVEVIRSMVDEASKDGGIALIVPQRTAGRGRGDEFLKGLNYRYAIGFAPHPEFTRWLRSTIEKGIAYFTSGQARLRKNER
ncbi:MAG: hypothetical protein ACE5JU_17115 [Candidatus Binatia bacterium]